VLTLATRGKNPAFNPVINAFNPGLITMNGADSSPALSNAVIGQLNRRLPGLALVVIVRSNSGVDDGFTIVNIIVLNERSKVRKPLGFNALNLLPGEVTNNIGVATLGLPVLRALTSAVPVMGAIVLIGLRGDN
jgi:hypothetical protein